MGMSPQVMPMFSSIWNSHIPTMHMTMSMPNRSLDELAIRKHIRMSDTYRASRAATPKNPSSSASTQKMKSVGASGKKPCVDCVAFKSPLPNSPPDPMAIWACLRFQPSLVTSESGFRNTSRRLR